MFEEDRGAGKPMSQYRQLIDKLVAEGRLDDEIVAVAKLHMDEAMLAARPSH